MRSLNHIQVDLERHKNELCCSINQSMITKERLNPNQHPPQPGEHPTKGAVVRKRSRPSFVHLICLKNLIARAMGRSFSIFNKGGEKHHLKLPSMHSFPEDQAPAEHTADAGQPSACHDRNPGGHRLISASLGNPHGQTQVVSELHFWASAAKTLLTLTLGTQIFLLDPAQISMEDPL